MRLLLAVVMVSVLATGCGDDGGASGTCADTLLPGDLVITEVFADYAAPPGGSGADEGNEWFEIYNASTRAIDLGGLTVSHSRADGSMRKRTTLPAVTIPAGGYFVLGNTLEDLRPAWVDIGYANKLGDLYNTGTGKLGMACGTTEIDVAFYGDTKSGESRALDGGSTPDYTVNDDLLQWCAASHVAANEFTPKNFGTPGRANDDCEIIVPGMCDGGDGLRPTVAPEPGDLVITEVMPNPAAVSDTLGEWFEVQVNRDVDLNGLALDRAGDSMAANVLTAERCLRVTAGSLVVFARSVDAGINGGLPRVDGTFKFTLVSGSASAPGDLALRVGDTLIDAFAWTSSRSGKALQVDPDAANAVDNDDEASWCDATQSYGDGDLGTPGAPNAQCGAVAPPGTCLDGATPRPVVTPEVGDLVITEVMPNPEAVSDTTGEWFEVLATRDVDLNGLGLDRAGDSANPNVISSATCVRLAAGQRAVFARSSNEVANGGLPAVTAGFTFALITGSASSPGDVQIVSGTTVLDAVTWSRSTPGASLQLDPAFTSVIDNDVETHWCDGTTAYGAGDLGTPGAANLTCTGGPAPGTCLDGGSPRPLASPGIGDLVITEVMPNPSAVADATGEWFEVLVTRDVDLNGLGLDRASDSLTPKIVASVDCLRVTAGQRLVFARSADPTANGGLPPITSTFNFALISGSAASPGDVQLVFAGMTLDSVVWTRSTAGASLQVAPMFENPTDNDVEANWCDGTTPYGLGDLGTPGDANAACGMTPAPGMCDLGGGVLRPIVKPLPGELVITEFLANPAGTYRRDPRVVRDHERRLDRVRSQRPRARPSDDDRQRDRVGDLQAGRTGRVRAVRPVRGSRAERDAPRGRRDLHVHARRHQRCGRGPRRRHRARRDHLDLGRVRRRDPARSGPVLGDRQRQRRELLRGDHALRRRDEPRDPGRRQRRVPVSSGRHALSFRPMTRRGSPAAGRPPPDRGGRGGSAGADAARARRSRRR